MYIHLSSQSFKLVELFAFVWMKHMYTVLSDLHKNNTSIVCALKLFAVVGMVCVYELSMFKLI